MGTRLVYGLAMRALDLPAPQLPYFYHHPDLTGPETQVPPYTLYVLRLVAVACAAAAMAIAAARWGWPALIPLALLAQPIVREDLARAWAEGPLLLGLAVALSLYGTRFFPLASAVAASFKLTALGLWPVVFLKYPLGKRRFAASLGLLATATMWSALTPASWFAGGPAYLMLMIVNRAREHAFQTALYGGETGFFLPSRYLLPLEFLAVGALAVGAAHVVFSHRSPFRRQAPAAA